MVHESGSFTDYHQRPFLHPRGIELILYPYGGPKPTTVYLSNGPSKNEEEMQECREMDQFHRYFLMAPSNA
jgi:hypothetical protein